MLMIDLIPVGFIGFPGQGFGPRLTLVETAKRGLVRIFFDPAGRKVNGVQAQLQGDDHNQEGDDRINNLLAGAAGLGHDAERGELEYALRDWKAWGSGSPPRCFPGRVSF